MLVCIFLFLNIIVVFLLFVWQNVPHQWKILPFVLATAPGVLTTLTKPICSLADTTVLSYYVFRYLGSGLF